MTISAQIDRPSALFEQVLPINIYNCRLNSPLPSLSTSFVYQGKMTMDNMHEDGAEPGAFGFDPLKLDNKDAAVREKYQLQEIKNGRLAMSAIGGLIHQSLLLHGGVPFHA